MIELAEKRQRRNRSIRPVGVFRSFQLHFEPFHADLETVHGLNGSLGAGRIVETDETWQKKRERGGMRKDDAKVDRGQPYRTEAVDIYTVELEIKMHVSVPKHLLWLVARSINTLELMTLPKGRNICISSASPNS